MNNRFNTCIVGVFLFIMSFSLAACEKEGGDSPELEAPAPTVTTTAFTATISGLIPDMSVEELNSGLRGVLYSDDPEHAQEMFDAWQEGSNNPGCSQYGIVKVSSDGIIESTLSGLKSGTVYAFCLYYQSKSSKKRVIGRTSGFTTRKFQCTIGESDAVNVRFYDAQLACRISVDANDMSECKPGVVSSTSAEGLSYESSHTEALSMKDDGSFTVKLRDLECGTEYFYRAYVLAEPTGEIVYGPVQSFTTRHTDEMVVDLGLSVKWSSCNLGAQEPYETGGYYKWGETEPSTNGERSRYSLWNSDNDSYIDIGEDICGTGYDAAHATLSGHWRMPTIGEIEELTSKCRMSMHTMGDYYVVEFTNNGASICVPVSGVYATLGKSGSYDPSFDLTATLVIQSGNRSAIDNEREVVVQRYERRWCWYVQVVPRYNEIGVLSATGEIQMGNQEYMAEYAIPIRPVWDPGLGQ